MPEGTLWRADLGESGSPPGRGGVGAGGEGLAPGAGSRAAKAQGRAAGPRHEARDEAGAAEGARRCRTWHAEESGMFRAPRHGHREGLEDSTRGPRQPPPASPSRPHPPRAPRHPDPQASLARQVLPVCRPLESWPQAPLPRSGVTAQAEEEPPPRPRWPPPRQPVLHKPPTPDSPPQANGPRPSAPHSRGRPGLCGQSLALCLILPHTSPLRPTLAIFPAPPTPATGLRCCHGEAFSRAVPSVCR